MLTVSDEIIEFIFRVYLIKRNMYVANILSLTQRQLQSLTCERCLQNNSEHIW